MKKIFCLLYIGVLLVCGYVFGQTSLCFEKNLGQWDKEILFKTSFKQGNVYLRQDRISVLLKDSNNHNFHPHNIDKKEKNNYAIFSIRPKTNNKAEIISLEQKEYYTNYFLSKDKHYKRVPCFESVVYKEIYNNIDWKIETENNYIKHTFVVHPKGRVEEIEIEYIGAESLITKEGELIITTKYGQITEPKPYIFQRKDNEIIRVEGGFVLKDRSIKYFVESYDENYDLEIDPGLVFSTYSGSHSDTWGMTSCYDQYGRIISGGIVNGENYPITEGAYEDTFKGNWDCVITKYNDDASAPVFSTFLGGSKGEMPHSMIVNSNEEIVILGTTGSSDFPTSDYAFQPLFKGGDAINYENTISYSNGADIFITCLSPMGDSVLASTFLGGSGNDGLNFKSSYGSSYQILYDGNDSLYANYGDIARGEVITDKDNNVYIASCTFSTDFPTSIGCYQNINKGGQEAVAVKLDRSLSHLLYSTYIGGTGNEAAYSLDIDSLNRIYISGGTTSIDFPSTNNAYNSSFNGGSTDAFLCRLSCEGTLLEASTFFGSSEYDQAFFVRLDNDFYPYIFGQTKASGSTLIHNVQYSIPNSGQFVAKFSKDLDSLKWSTVFGSGDGMINISPVGFAVDICGRIYCAGWGRVFKYQQNSLGYAHLGTENLQTSSNAYSTQTDGQDFYIMAMERDAAGFNYGSFFGEVTSVATQGADHVDGGTSRFDRYGNLYQTICASCGGSQGMPVSANAYSSANLSSNCNMGSFKFEVNNDFAVANFKTPAPSCNTNTISFENLSRGDSFLWNFGDGTTSSSSSYSPTHTYQNAGTYQVTLIANSSNGCRLSDTIIKNVIILGDTSYYIDSIETCASVPIQIGINFNYYGDDVSFVWHPGNMVSDSTIISPYFIGIEPQLLCLIIDNNECKDTIYQYVNTTKLSNNIIDTFNFCSLPMEYFLPEIENTSIELSFDREFIDLITPSLQQSIIINDTTNKYLYFSLTNGNCRNVDSVYLNYSGYDFELEIINTGCLQDNNGQARVLQHSFPSEVSYHWSCSNKDTNAVENLSAGVYTIRLQDNNGCSLEKEFVITSYSDLNVEVETKNNSCIGVNNGEIVLHISGGLSPYTIEWNNSLVDTILQNLFEGVYTYNITDQTGCNISGAVNIEPLYAIQIELEQTENNCPTGCSAQILSYVSFGQEPYSYAWSNGESSPNIYDLCNGSYSIVVEDNNGCKGYGSAEITNIDIFENFETWASDYRVYDGAKITLYSTELEGFTYLWSPSDNLSSPTKPSTSATMYESTDFSVFVTDNKGCYKEDTLHIEVEFVDCGEPNIFIPNAFTPNGDGINDFVAISGEYIASLNFAIYDRWGEKVFSTTDINQTWDGTFRGKPCQAGVYYYKLEVNCEGGKTFVKGGDITLIR
ncbi:MAG: gliding motility-associated C-terminal domain-containing protein [Bacteroidota bacterium]|nr:gliding motility-associated C-terminal domain-containing protein [Bacteroidota bacterium]